MSFFYKLAESFRRFMQGRYGTDTLNKHLVFLWLILSFANIFLQSLAIYILELVLCALVFFRMFSRNIFKRQAENAAYYRFTTSLKKKYSHFFVRIRDRKQYHFFRCPRCSAPIKMPRRVGKFRIRCQKCGESFVKEFRK